jgi:uncharacterized delta-60 repeat protein
MNGTAVNNIVRLNSNGTLDPSFSFNVNGVVEEIAIQTDGKILIRGQFSTVNGASRPMLARLNADGATLDTSFAPTFTHTLPATPSLRKIFLQRDGKVLIGGNFDNVSGTARQNIVRLNGNGTVDTAFTSSANFPVTSFAEELGGRLTIGGQFTTFNGVAFASLVKVSGANGALATAFSQNITGIPQVILIQSDAKMLIAGSITNVGGVARNGVAKISWNRDGAVQDLTLSNGIASWRSVFNAPQIHRVIFEKSDDGISYTFLGEATPQVDGITWQLTGVTVSGGYIRARGLYPDASNQQSSVEFVRYIPRRAGTVFDFDGDGKTDIGIFRPAVSGGEWWINRSGNGQTFALQFGASTDTIAPADYTGDGKADIAFFRPSSGEWYVLRSEDFSFFALPFGTNGDIPVPADYDNDGKADFAVFRPSTSTWFISQSSGAPTRIEQFGVSGDQPIVSDYDGDGKADVGIFRPAATGAEWWINRSTTGLLAMQFGAPTDKAVQGDYTGDGKADIAIWRPATGEWLIVRSEDFSFYGFPFGSTGDLIAPGDYDGDGKFDPTVFRPSSSTWFVARTTAGTLIVQFGANGDRPIPNAFVP